MPQIAAMFDGLEVPDDAALTHDLVVERLETLGYVIRREYRVATRGDAAQGRLDLLAERSDGNLAIEIDRRSPRQKSLVKLRQIPDAARLVLLRLHPGEYWSEPIEGITAVVSLRCPDAPPAEASFVGTQPKGTTAPDSAQTDDDEMDEETTVVPPPKRRERTLPTCQRCGEPRVLQSAQRPFCSDCIARSNSHIPEEVEQTP